LIETAHPQFICDFDKFIFQVIHLYQIIEDARLQRIKEYDAIGYHRPARIKFEELDLHQYKNEMLSVHKTLQWRGHNRFLKENTQKARIVAIAGICELIKDEFVGRFWDMYEKTIGWKGDSTVYDWIWEAAFIDEGIQLIHSTDRREFVQTLVLESGVPKSRTKDIIDLFVIYWRYLRGTGDVETIINLVNGGQLVPENIPWKERDRFNKLCSNASDFSKAFALAVNKLCRIFEFIEVCDEIVSGRVEEYVEIIAKNTGIHPLEVIRDQEQLIKLYNLLLGLVTPEKLLKIFQAKSPGTSVRTPDGATLRIDRYKDVLLGEHILDGVRFVCVPTTSLQLGDLISLHTNIVTRIGNSILLKSRSEITAFVNGIVRSDLTRKLFITGREKQFFEGYIFFVEQRPAITISLQTADGKVNTTIRPTDGFHCFPVLMYSGQISKNTHNLSVNIGSFRLMSSQHIDKEIIFKIDSYEEPLACVTTNRDGFVYCSERIAFLKNPAPGVIRISAYDCETGSVLDINGNNAESMVTLNHSMLFSPYTHYEIKPVRKGKPARFGGKKFVLFTDVDSINDRIEMSNLQTLAESSCGAYSIKLISWVDISKPCSLTIHKEQDLLEWRFEKCLHFNLYLNKLENNAPVWTIFTERQGLSPSDFEIVISPIPDEHVEKDLFWNIVINDSPPFRMSYTQGPKGRIDGGSLRISREDIKDLLHSFWMQGAGAGNACIEISLCVLENVFATVKFWVFPLFTVQLPEVLREGEEFFAWVHLGDSIKKEVVLKDNRGKSRIRYQISFSNELWELKEREYKGSLEMETLGTSVEIRAIPPLRGCRLGNRETGLAEMPRDLLRRELDNLDLLVFTDDQRWPMAFVDSKKVALKFSKSKGIMVAWLGDLPDVLNREQNVKIISGEVSVDFVVSYRPAVISVNFNELVVNNHILGTCSLRGPIGAFLNFKVFEDNEEGQLIAQVKISCDGREHSAYPLNIYLGELENERHPKYLIRLFLYDQDNQDSGHEYGETWLVSPEPIPCSDNYDYLKNKALTAFADGSFFMAQRFLQLSKPYSPANDALWLRDFEKKISHAILLASMRSIVLQTSKVLKKEFLFEIFTS
jgi:hypothetical protein